MSQNDEADTTMTHQDIEDYAMEQINAAAYPDDIHRCFLFHCSSCQRVMPFSLRISYSKACGDERPAYDFAGTVNGTCSQCSREQILLSIKIDNYAEEEQEHPVCTCGADTFVLCMCDRYEGPSGLEGFFDEGVLVGKCETCGTHKTFLYTD
jgi:hypothetical protein